MPRFRPLGAVCAVAATLIAAPLACPALAQVPPGANPATGARPGNEIGTGQSLPLSNNASNINGADTRSLIAPRLPSPPGGQNAPTRQYLTDALNALASGQTGQAQEALERAETSVLDRSVNPMVANQPSQQPLVLTITQALNALGNRDLARTQQLTQQALSMVPPG